MDIVLGREKCVEDHSTQNEVVAVAPEGAERLHFRVNFGTGLLQPMRVTGIGASQRGTTYA
jgi:hypothetical protein